jgi:hypothetical protein
VNFSNHRLQHVFLDSAHSRTKSSTFLPASACFRAAMICAPLCFPIPGAFGEEEGREMEKAGGEASAERNGNGTVVLFQRHYGQVAQLVERSPEKAGVGGSIPSLATTK